MNQAEKKGDRQYVEWLRAGGIAKSNGERASFSGNRILETMCSDGTWSNSQLAVENPKVSIRREKERILLTCA